MELPENQFGPIPIIVEDSSQDCGEPDPCIKALSQLRPRSEELRKSTPRRLGRS